MKGYETEQSVFDKAFKKQIKNLPKIPIDHIDTKYTSLHKTGEIPVIKHHLNSFGLVSFSTYNFVDETATTKAGEPNCDNCCIMRYSNCTVSIISDGCGWGEESANCAKTIVEVSADTTRSLIDECETLRDVGQMLVTCAYNSQIQLEHAPPKSKEESGATLLITASVVSENKMYTVLLSIGDCKGFKYSRKNETTTVLNGKWHDSVTGMSECKCRLGKTTLCLHDCELRCYECQANDCIITCSDGFYDNFNPKLLKDKKERECLLDSVISTTIKSHNDMKSIVETLSNYIIDYTKELRDFHMRCKKMRPIEMKGKLDHSTICIYAVNSSFSDVFQCSTYKCPAIMQLYPAKSYVVVQSHADLSSNRQNRSNPELTMRINIQQEGQTNSKKTNTNGPKHTDQSECSTNCSTPRFYRDN